MSSEKSIFDVLPGQLMAVADVMETLSGMWQAGPAQGQELPAEFRASQMNLVLHFGLQSSLDEALETFNLAIEFAQRYPCRLIVLCPRGREVSDKLLESKLFSQCYIGDAMRSMCCCEALILGYPTRVAGFLDNQVSIWLESDLPSYHWFHRVPAERIEKIHMDFTKRCRRVIIDTSVEGLEFKNIHWARPGQCKDLAYARLLPVRQLLGQFFSAYDPKVLVEGLEAVTVRHSERFMGEANGLLAWLSQSLKSCQKQSNLTQEIQFDLKVGCKDTTQALELEWIYADAAKKQFGWSFSVEASQSKTKADFGSGSVDICHQIKLLSKEKTLSEAMFFA